jgi:hypothetical protein
MLTHLADGVAQERPSTTVARGWAAAKPSLRAVLDQEIGAEIVKGAYAQTARSMGLPESTAKNGHLVRAAVGCLYAEGHESKTLDKIVRVIIALRRPGEPGDLAAELSEPADTV